MWPPENVATQFVASTTKLYVRPPLDVKIWSYDDDFELLDTISASDDFRKTEIRLDNLQKALLLIMRPASEEVTVWPRVSSTVQAAALGGVSKRWSLSCHRFQVDGQPFIPQLHWNYGPGSHSGNYGSYKRFFHVPDREGVIWQDFAADAVKVTYFSNDLLASETHRLVGLASQLLIGAYRART